MKLIVSVTFVILLEPDCLGPDCHLLFVCTWASYLNFSFLSCTTVWVQFLSHRDIERITWNNVYTTPSRVFDVWHLTKFFLSFRIQSSVVYYHPLDELLYFFPSWFQFRNNKCLNDYNVNSLKMKNSTWKFFTIELR